MVAVDDVVVPVAGAELEGVGALEAEGALPRTGLGVSVLELGERELVLVVVPGAEEVDGLDVGGGAQVEGELDGWAGHFERLGGGLLLLLVVCCLQDSVG